MLLVSMNTRVSVIVLNWNGRKWLEKCLSSILGQDITENFEVILVDNGSTDDSVKYVRERFSQVKVIELEENYGFAEGNNLGLKHARGDYIVFVNTDTEAMKGWLQNLVKATDEHKDYQILCSIQFPSQERNRVRTLNAFGYPMPSPSESELAITDSIFASGGCFLIRRSWVSKLGGLFDPSFFCNSEDLDLSLRTILLGGRIGYVRDSRIYHYIGGSSFQSSKMLYFSERNLLFVYYKLFSLKNFARIFFVQIAYLFGRLFARNRQLSNTFGMMKGVMGFFFGFHLYLNYRKSFMVDKKRNDKYVFERFLYRGRKQKTILKRAIYGV